MTRQSKPDTSNKRPPARTVGAREQQLINKATRLAEKQLDEGSASAQVIVHYLRLGTTLAEIEREKLIRENDLLRAKTEALQSTKKLEDLYLSALSAMRTYNGKSGEDDGD
jgi:predicted ATP-dependent protease